VEREILHLRQRILTQGITSPYMPAGMNLKSTAVNFGKIVAFFLIGIQSLVAAPAVSKGSFELFLSAVDANENPLPSLVAGEYVRLRVKALVNKVPDTAAVLLSAKASFSMILLGRKVAYSVNLPAQGASNSTLNPTVGMPDSGKKLGTEYEKQVIEEIYDFHIPAETPAGSLKVTVTASATSIPKFSKTFAFQVVRH
jgi:hypothetical protein